MGFVSSVATTFNNAIATKTLSVTVGVGDAIAIIGETFVGTNTLGTPTGGSLTYTLRQSIVAVSSHNNVYLWTAPSASAQTFTMSITMAGTVNNWGYVVLRFSNITSVGASNKGTGSLTAPSISLTTTGAGSLIAMGDSDFDASASAATYLTGAGTFNETLHDTSGGGGTFWAGYYGSAGVTGAKTVGMSAPTQTWSLVAVELLTPAVVALPRRSLTVNKALRRSSVY